jgi:hypothetical protein
MGPLTLEGLAPGQFRELTPREVKELQRTARGEREKGDRAPAKKPAKGAKGTTDDDE